MRRLTIVCTIILAATLTASENIRIVTNGTISPKTSFKPGEAQSTVVRPGLKSQCKAGRYLVTNDALRPPSQGLVVGRNLDDLSGSDILAKFNNPPGQIRLRPLANKAPLPSEDPRLYPRYDFVTNDHDLVVLNNGDVLYITGAASRAYVNVPWFEQSYRETKLGPFGPGARSVLLTWKSTDCGETFQYAGEMDPAHMEDGSCAMPQFRRDASGNIISGRPYDMGGADGQTVRVDPVTNRLYLTFSCVGYHSRAGREFTLDASNALNKTLVAISDDAGASWRSLGFVDYAVWRLPALPVSADTIAFGIDDGVLFGTKSGGTYAFDKKYVAAPDANFGWPGFPFETGQSNPWLYTNIYGHNIAARTPGTSDFFIAYANKAEGKGYGYRLAFYDRKAKAFGEADDDILPATAGANNFIFQLTAVDNGTGPVLLYWYDIDGDARTATIRGRLVYGAGAYSADFPISVDDKGAARSFKFIHKGPQSDWYGDYRTAAGYRDGMTDTYYPTWIEPFGNVRFARIDASQSPRGTHMRRAAIAANRWRPQGPAVIAHPIHERE